jgi:isocitrate dehydrogenase (NAD+)
VKWEPVDVTPQLKDGKTTIPSETIESIKRNKVALKGPLAVRMNPDLIFASIDRI